jgi:hypothetical protein
MPKPDKDEAKSTRVGLGRILFPWRRIKTLDPRARIKGQRDVGSSFSFALSAIKKGKNRTTCPSCRATGSMALLNAIHHDSGDSTYHLGCQNCDHAEEIEMQLAAISKTIDNLRIGERRFLIASGCAAAFGFLYYFLTGYLFTLIGAMMIAATLLMNSLLLRYRVWQYVHKRLYEKRAPLMDWLRYEVSS